MKKEIVLRARVKAHHEQRVKELCEQHHLTVSDLFRELIEGAEVKARPVLGATLYVDNSNALTFHGERVTVA